MDYSKPVHIVYTTFYEGEDEVRRELQIDGLGAATTGGEARSVIEALTEAIPHQATEDDDSIYTSFATVLDPT